MTLKLLVSAGRSGFLIAATTTMLVGTANADPFDDCVRLSGSEAISACSDAISNPEYRGSRLGQLYFERAREWSKLKRYRRAIEDYSKSIEVEPDGAAYNNRGIVYDQLGEHKRAIADFTKAIKIEQRPERYNNRGIAYVKLRRFDPALKDFDAALRLRPDSKDALFNRGSLFLDLRQFERAIADFDAAIRADSRFASAYFNRGLAHERRGAKRLAIADFQRVLDVVDPDNRALRDKALRNIRRLSGNR